MKHIDNGENFVVNHHEMIFVRANSLMHDEERSYFRSEFITFIAEELRKFLGIKDSLKECSRGSISFGGYHCSVNEFLSSVLLAFPELQISVDQMLEKLENIPVVAI
ncbi:MAG: hypothetical protein ISN64_00595 [Rickettsia sp.]|nr:hypothetical protein [Rickettsia sp.]